MIARQSSLKHPSGIEIKTPILIPSYSSKGFEISSDGVSEITEPMEICKDFLEESILVSAYDLHYKHIIEPEEFVSTKLVFIDSGGYETGNNYDFSATKKFNRKTKHWNEDLLIKTIKSWPEQHFPAVIVNYDDEKDRKAISKQIEDACNLFKLFPNFLHDFLIKPETDISKYVKINHIINHIEELSQFDIIGITEKELGNSISQRMRNIIKIRSELDNENISAPLHIFGSLDPVTSILYFLAGAEIFDGLTWLRYSYHNSMAIYHPNFGFFNKEIDIRTTDKNVQLKSLTHNIYYLDKMKYAMLDYLKNGNFDFFDDLIDDAGFGELLQKSFDSVN